MQQPSAKDWYQAHEFAELAGVTVRALHHYDRLGLLKPKKRSSAGYGLYQLKDLERVEQIVALNSWLERAIEMQKDSNWMTKYYSPEAQAKIAERAKTFTPEMQAQVSQAWKDYYRDLAALKDQNDPGGVKAAELSKRHRELVAAFTGNDPEVEAGLKALYKDRANWPAELSERLKEYGA